MKSIWQEANRRELADRVSRLVPSASPRWGKMSAPRMLAHLVDAARMALGTLEVPSKRLPIHHPPLKQLIIYWLPFPKNAPTAPQLVARVATDWAAEASQLNALVDQLAARSPEPGWPDHPAFGRMTHRAWGVLVYRHTDHHLRQFGV